MRVNMEIAMTNKELKELVESFAKEPEKPTDKGIIPLMPKRALEGLSVALALLEADPDKEHKIAVYLRSTDMGDVGFIWSDCLVGNPIVKAMWELELGK